MATIENVIAELSQQSGLDVTEEQAKAYLDREGLTPDAYMAEVDAFKKQAAVPPPEPPDPERDPEGYEYYKYMTNPQG